MSITGLSNAKKLNFEKKVPLVKIVSKLDFSSNIRTIKGRFPKRMSVESFGFMFLIIIPLVNLPMTAGGQFQTNPGEPAANPFTIPDDERPPAIRDSNLKIETVASGLNKPTAMAFLSPNDILVLEKDNGTVRRIVNGEVQKDPVLTVAVANDNETNERGLLGLAVDKESATKTYVFLYYTESGDGITGSDAHGIVPAGNRLYRYELVETNGGKTVKLVNPKLLLDLPARPGPRYEGGKLLVRHEQNNSTGTTVTSVYLQIGYLDKKGIRQMTMAQNNKRGPPADGTGGILRLDIEGNPLPNAPLVSSSNNNNNNTGDIGMLRYYFAYGIRNGFGMDFDPITGKLWDTENGPTYGDEINLVEPGFNSGFSKMLGGLASAAYNAHVNIGRDLEDFGGLGKYSDPQFVWNNTVGVTAIKFLNSTKLGQQYANDIFVGDIKNGRIYHFKLNADRIGLKLDEVLSDKVADNVGELDKVIFGTGFRSISDIELGSDGHLYVLLYGSGRLMRIVPAAEEGRASD